MCVPVSTCICTCICMYIYREREEERVRICIRVYIQFHTFIFEYMSRCMDAHACKDMHVSKQVQTVCATAVLESKAAPYIRLLRKLGGRDDTAFNKPGLLLRDGCTSS